MHGIKNKVDFEDDVEINAVYCMKQDFHIGCRSEHQHERNSAFYSKVKSEFWNSWNTFTEAGVAVYCSYSQQIPGKKTQLLVRLLKLDTSFFCFLVKIWCLTFEVCWIVFVQGAEGKHVGVTQQDWSESQTCCLISLLLVLVLWDLLTTRKIQNITKHIRKHLRWVNETRWFSK